MTRRSKNWENSTFCRGSFPGRGTHVPRILRHRLRLCASVDSCGRAGHEKNIKSRQYRTSALSTLPLAAPSSTERTSCTRCSTQPFTLAMWVSATTAGEFGRSCRARPHQHFTTSATTREMCLRKLARILEYHTWPQPAPSTRGPQYGRTLLWNPARCIRDKSALILRSKDFL